MLKDTFREQSNQALKNKDVETRKVMNNIVSKFLEVEKSGTFTGWTEALEQDTVRSYIKSLQKAIEQIKTGPVVEGYQREIDMLATYLPKQMDEAETRALVESLLPNARGMGQLMGLVMKNHRERANPELVKRIATELGLK